MLQRLLDYLSDQEYIAFDTETTGTNKDSTIIGISIAADVDTAYYLILYKWDVASQQLLEVMPRSVALEVLALLIGKNLIAHNAVFDCNMINNNFGIDLMPYVHTDTMVLGQLLDENRSNGLKELGTSLFGDNAKKEQIEMKESVKTNGGSLTKAKYELYKADSQLIAKYGAKDALLTMKLFYALVEDLYSQNLQAFFYEDESMPLLRGPTYDLNTTGLRVDTVKLEELKGTLEAECLDLKSFIYKEIDSYIKDKYPGTKKTNSFNIGASQQLAWLLFEKLDNPIGDVTDAGLEICKSLNIRPPYSKSDKRTFVQACKDNLGLVYGESDKRSKKIGEYWKYTSTDKTTLQVLASKYEWVNALLKYNKNMKILSTYITGLQDRMLYSIIHPSFLQIGTTSGRYSSKNPNFQNLPRDDKRIKECIVARPGKVFVGADYEQLEPRVFASISQDPTLMACFAKGEDFYSVVGAPIWDKTDCSMIKDDKESFAKKYPQLRNMAKAFALATPYGTTAFKQSHILGIKKEECQNIIDRYFQAYPKVELMMLTQHSAAKADGIVYNLYGRPRRIPEAKSINRIYGEDTPHGELPYEARTLLNLGMNHKVQSSAASIVNRAAIALWKAFKDTGIEAKIILQVHDELIVECLEEDSSLVVDILKHCMENTTKLSGVDLRANPMVALNLGDLK